MIVDLVVCVIFKLLAWLLCVDDEGILWVMTCTQLDNAFMQHTVLAGSWRAMVSSLYCMACDGQFSVVHGMRLFVFNAILSVL